MKFLQGIIATALLLLLSCSLSAQNQQDSSKNGRYIFKKNDKDWIVAYYKNTKRHQIWTWYMDDGTVDKKIKYKKGRRIWTIYYEKNKVWLKIDRFGKRRIIRQCRCRETG